MESIFVESSMISSIGYDVDNATLEIEYKTNGQVWHYFDVAEYVFEEMKYAESVGRYYHASIKGQYQEARVR